MCLIYYFRENSSSFIEKTLSDKTRYAQVGRGLIFWGETENRKAHIFRDGVEVDSVLRGCKLMTNAGYAYRISGKDHKGREWLIMLGDGLSYKKVEIKKKRELFVRKEHIIRLFDGSPFAEVVGECCCEIVSGQKFGKLDEDISFAKKARKVLQEAFFLIIKQKGSGASRVKVCTTIKKLLASR